MTKPCRYFVEFESKIKTDVVLTKNPDFYLNYDVRQVADLVDAGDDLDFARTVLVNIAKENGGWAELFERTNIEDRGFMEPFGWIPQWQWDSELIFDSADSAVCA